MICSGLYPFFLIPSPLTFLIQILHELWIDFQGSGQKADGYVITAKKYVAEGEKKKSSENSLHGEASWDAC
jgi:hypothetical protein